MQGIEKDPLTEIREVFDLARKRVQRTVNSAMVESYWQIGRLIAEHEQQAGSQATYGAQQLQQLAERLAAEFGRGFNARNLLNMRDFYQAFPIWNAVRTELSWAHYRTLLRVDNETIRDWYMQEAADQHWSARALERQIGVLYYERLLSSQDRDAVQQEADQRTQPRQPGLPSRSLYPRLSEPAG